MCTMSSCAQYMFFFFVNHHPEHIFWVLWPHRGSARPPCSFCLLQRAQLSRSFVFFSVRNYPIASSSSARINTPHLRLPLRARPPHSLIFLCTGLHRFCHPLRPLLRLHCTSAPDHSYGGTLVAPPLVVGPLTPLPSSSTVVDKKSPKSSEP
jgi:hypothetical protein